MSFVNTTTNSNSEFINPTLSKSSAFTNPTKNTNSSFDNTTESLVYYLWSSHSYPWQLQKPWVIVGNTL